MKHLGIFTRGSLPKLRHFSFFIVFCSLLIISYSLFPAPAHAGYLTINADGNSSNGTAAGNSITVNKPANTDDGDFMLAVGTIEDIARQINAPSDWTRLNYTSLTTRAVGQFIWYKVASGEGASYAFTTSDAVNDEYAVSIVTYSNVDINKPINDWDSQWNNAVANCTIPSITINNAGNFGVSLCSSAYGTTWTAPAGTPAYNERADYRTQNAAAAVSHEIADGSYAAAGATGAQTATPANTDYNIGTHLDLQAATDYTFEQEGFRWREDNGSETTATWLKNQDTNITREVGYNTRLRALLNSTGDPDSLQYGLSFKKTTDTVWKRLGTSTGSITYAAAGAAVAQTTQVIQVAYPANIAIGDLLVFGVTNKIPSATTVPTPLGWTALANNNAAAGLGTDGTADQGQARITVFYRIADGSEQDNNLDLVLSGIPNVAYSRILRYTKASGKTWSLAAAQGTDTSASTAWSVTGNVDPGFTAGDLAIVFSAINSDGPTWTTHAMTEAGGTATFAAGNERQDAGTTSGADIKLVISDLAVTAGTSTGVPTYTMTASASDNTNYPTGATVILRARQVDDPIQLGASANIAASGVDTTYQLTAPSGKSSSDFVTGRLMDDENPADAVNITTDDYTELEWSLLATSQASTNDIYQFRVTINGTMINTYTVDPRWTIGVEANTQYSINKLEQQINIINQEYTTTGTAQPTDNSLGLIQWDSTKYTGAIAYFEAVIYCSACTGGNTAAKADLYTSAGVAVTNATVSTTATSYTRVRSSAAITGNLSDNEEYTVRLTRDSTAGTAYIQAARIIVIQIDDTKITKTQNQIEVGNFEEIPAAQPAQLISGVKIFHFDTAYFNPYNEIYFEASLTSASFINPVYAALSSSSTCATTIVDSEISSLSQLTYELVRSNNIQADFQDDTNYYVCVWGLGGGYLSNAKIIINQSQSIGLQNVQLIHHYINTPKTDSDNTYTSQNFLNQYKASNISADQVTAYFESTLMTSAGTGYARLYNSSDATALGSTEITTTGTSYSRIRSADITSSLPTSAKNLDTQLQNSAANTTTASSSWLILNVESLIDNSLKFSISGVNSGTTTNGVVTSANSTYNSLPFGNINPLSTRYLAHQLYASTNAANGYYVTATLTNYLQGLSPNNNIDPFSGTWTSPSTWSVPSGTSPNDNTGWIGANTSDTRIPAWTSGSGKFAGVVHNNNHVVMFSQSADEGTNIYVTYGLEVNTNQPIDSYSGNLLYTILPTY